MKLDKQNRLTIVTSSIREILLIKRLIRQRAGPSAENKQPKSPSNGTSNNDFRQSHHDHHMIIVRHINAAKQTTFIITKKET